MPNPKEVELKNINGVTKTLGYGHALSLLKTYNTWSLPKDSKLEFTEDAIRFKPSKGANKAPKERKGDKGSDLSRGEA